MEIYLDECGYTGEDLINPEQPVFTLASINFTEEKSLELKERFFGSVKAKELKHNLLVKYPKQQNLIIDFLGYMSHQREHMKLLSVCKPYSLVCHLVDILVENSAYEDGIDLYDRGLNIALANLYFYCLPAFGGKEFFDKLSQQFQKMLRMRTESSYDDFFRPLYEKQYSKELDELLVFIKYAHLRLGFEFIRDLPRNMLDVGLSYALNLMALWRTDTTEELYLIHDRSSAMSKQSAIWNALVDPNVPPKVVGYDRRKMTYPIAVHDTRFEDSENYVGLQLADVLAGALAYHGGWLVNSKNPSDEYGVKLHNIFLNMDIDQIIWPSPKVTPADLETIGENAENPIGHFIEITKKNK